MVQFPGREESQHRGVGPRGRFARRLARRDGEFVEADPAETVAEANERASRIFADAEDDWRAADSELVARAEEGWL